MATPLLLIDGSRGIYIPKYFEELYGDQIPEELEDERPFIKDPNNEFYWDAWGTILDEMKLVIDGVTYTLQQDDDVWAIPEENEEPLGI